MNMRLFTILSTLLLCSCASYYTKTYKFNTAFQQGNLKAADEVLASDKKAESRKTKLLYYLNRGLVNSMQGNYAVSNDFFEKAYIYTEDRTKNYLAEGASFLTNPNITEYKGEDFELIMIHYYKAFNFMKLGLYESALVECRRMDIKLNALEDKYKSKHKYRKDAFVHLLMGIVYDANRDYNNAFIAYRNAVEIYQKEYATLFGITVPEQLKYDLLRAAYRTGFYNEVSYYEKEFGIKYVPAKDTNSELVFLWNNGLGPIKEEWSLNFTIVKGSGGAVTFVNSDLGLNFPFYMSDDDYRSSGLGDLSIVRVAFPKYKERPLVYTQGTLELNGKNYTLEKTESINAIAFKSLEDRMLKEMSTALLRMAVKKSAEMALRKKNQDAGAVLSILNAVTEQADTRNWQTLPHSIYYSRVPLKEGENKISLSLKGANGQNSNHTITIPAAPNSTYFHSFSSLNFVPVYIY